MKTETITAIISWNDDNQREWVTFGVMPEGYDGSYKLEHDNKIFYWLDKYEVERFDYGFGNDEWTVVDILRFDDKTFVCPRCGEESDWTRRALSRLTTTRDNTEWVCSLCGVEEAFEQFRGELVDWRPQRQDKVR